MTRRIVFLNAASCGGAERMTILYAKILQKAGLSCKMYIHVKPGCKVELLDFIPPELDYQIIETRHRFLLFHLMRILMKKHCDVVFCSMPVLVQLLVLAKFLTFRKFIIIARCFNMPSKLPPKTVNIMKWFQYTDKIISQTDEMRQELISYMNFPSEKIITITNPIDTELINEKIKEPFHFDTHYVNFTAVGRISEQKDYMTMILAFKKILNTRLNSRLYIIGKVEEKKYYAQLQEKIEELGLKDYIFFEGFQSNPYKYIYHSDAFLLSSVYEGLPNVLLDALYLKKSVVATKSIPFIEQIVKNGINGYSVDVQDSHEFAISMLKAIELKNEGYTFNYTQNSEENIIKVFTM